MCSAATTASTWSTSSDQVRGLCWWHSDTSSSAGSLVEPIPRRRALVDCCPPLFWRRGLRKSPAINNDFGGATARAAPGSPEPQVVPTFARMRGRDSEASEEVPLPPVAIGTRVGKEHSNYALAFCMLTGIRHSVSRVEAKNSRELFPGDFKAKHKIAFDIAGRELTPSSRYDFKFKDYAPLVFKEIRKAFRVDPADYLLSLTAKYIVSELASSGKSGSFFYYSSDYKYIIKTIHHSEAKVLQKLLPAYHEHVRTQPNTLLSQFYGLHRIKLPYGHKIHFVIMNNIFPLHREMHARYDLKGSEIGRETLKEGKDVTLKDINWLNNKQHLRFGQHRNKLLIDQLEIDTAFLKKNHLMDYSLLVGIHDTERGNDQLYADNLKLFHPGAAEADAPPQSDFGGSTIAGRQVSSRKTTVEEIELRNHRLRSYIRHDRPTAIGDYINQIPIDESRKGFTFYGDEGGFQSTDAENMPLGEVYYMGIIDCLTEWSMLKRIENKWKAFKSDALKISPIKPTSYAERFMRFMQSQTVRYDGTVRCHPAQAKCMQDFHTENEKLAQKMQ